MALMWLALRRPPERLTGEDVLQRLRARLPGPMRGAAMETPLGDLPIDSLDTVELLCLLDDEFGVRLDDGEFQRLRTVGHIAEVVADRASGGGRS